MTLELHATPRKSCARWKRLQEFGEAQEIPAKILFGLTLALEECGSNIVNHALHRDPEQTFRVTFKHTGSEIIIELRDPGVEFDPTLRQPASRQPTTTSRPAAGGFFSSADTPMKYATPAKAAKTCCA